MKQKLLIIILSFFVVCLPLPASLPCVADCQTLAKAFINELPEFAGTRHRLEPIRRSDIPRLKQILGDPEAVSMSGCRHDDTTIQRIVDSSAQVTESFHYWERITLGIRDKNNGRLIGMIMFFQHGIGGTATLGFALAKDQWGQGIATEMVRKAVDFAFRKLDLKIIDASALQTNIGSNRVLQKIGFKKTGEQTMDPGTRDNVYLLTQKDFVTAGRLQQQQLSK